MIDPTPRLVLASGSPRRLELLQQLGLDPMVCSPDVDESAYEGEHPDALVERLALSKIAGVTEQMSSSDGVQALCIVAADTMVVHGGQALGKPTDRDQALAMLAQLSDAEHQVITGVAASFDDTSTSFVVSTRVQFGVVTPAAASAYWETGEPVGKAGAYAIQGRGARFVMSLHGSYSNVVGLPLFETAAVLESLGYSV